MQEVGGLIGRFLLALLAVRIISRRRLLRVFQVPGLLVVPLVFYFFLTVKNQHFFDINLTSLYMGEVPVTVVSLMVFRGGSVHGRLSSASGEIICRASTPYTARHRGKLRRQRGRPRHWRRFWGVTNYLAFQVFSPGGSPESFTRGAAITALFVFAAGLLLSFFLPEPKEEMLPE